MNKKMVVVLIVSLVLVIVVAYSFNTLQTEVPKNDNQTNVSGDEAITISSIGRWVKPNDSVVSLYFPEGAVSTDMGVTIESIKDVPDEEGIVKDLGFEFGPDGAVFNTPVYLYIDYSGVTLPEGVEEYMLRIYKIEDTGNFTLISDCEVDLDSKTVEGKIYTFSKYVVMGKNFGIIVHSDKDRLANDCGLDLATITVFMKNLKEGDVSEPTGESLGYRGLKMEYGKLSMNGEYTKTDTASAYTDLSGRYSFTVSASQHADEQKYGIIKISDTFHRVSTTLYFGLGSGWPYYNHFDGDIVGPEWVCYDVIDDGPDTSYVGPQPISIETSPNGKEKFLGPFTTNQIVLSLENIPPHYRIVLEFDLIAIGPWQYGPEDQFDVTILNDPDQAGYGYCSKHVSLQEKDYTGGFDENDIINTLGYPTTGLTYYDYKGDPVELETGDGIFHISTNKIQHGKDSIQIAFNVDQRGFNGETDVGQFWGLDNIYVRYWGGF